MCGIFCSFDKKKIDELRRLNSYRGSHSYSVFAVVNEFVFRAMGDMDMSMVPETGYKVCHVQAPTTDARSIDSVHPATKNGCMLWHNGIIKNFDVARLQKKQGTTIQWDTALLLEELDSDNWLSNLSEINGSFACVFYDGEEIYVFRNEISPLFYDDELNISSVKFEGSRSLPPNKVFMLDFKQKCLIDMDFNFTTKENPYYMPQ